MTTKHTFDPNLAASPDSGVFGLLDSFESAALVYLPIPWEATTSYGGGTSLAPEAIIQASKQVDLFDFDVERPYLPGLFALPISEQIANLNTEAKRLATPIIEAGGEIKSRPELQQALSQVNALSSKLNDWVYHETKRLYSHGKIPGLIGGDHSVPFGAFKAATENVGDLGILHIDAHSDTRIAYEGFEWSHASIMYNALTQIPEIKILTQVGIRDFCEQEFDFCQSQSSRVKTYFDGDLQRKKMGGQSWAKMSDEIIATLPQSVWISFDIDGLDPRFCPHTGTPVPGGLDFNEAVYLIRSLVVAGRKIVGFDLNEIAPSQDPSDEWDANVGARLLYKLTGFTLASQGLCKLRNS